MLKLSVLRVGVALFALSISGQAVAQATGGLSVDIDAAAKKLDEDIQACRPIDVKSYEDLQKQSLKNVKAAQSAQKKGLPIDAGQVASDASRAQRLLDQAKAAAAKQKEACQPPQQSATTGPQPPSQPPPPTPPGTTTPSAGGPPPPEPPIPPPPPRPIRLPRNFYEPGSAQEFMEFSVDDAEDAFDDYEEAAANCDAKGMQEALDDLKALEKKAEDIRDGAEMAGKESKIRLADAKDVYDTIHGMVLDTQYIKMRCPYMIHPLPQVPGQCPPKGAQPQVPQSTVPLDHTSQSLLDYQNGLRAQYGMPALRWNTALSDHAFGYALTLSQTGEVQHSSRIGRETERENIVVGVHGATSPLGMAQVWGNELQYFRPGKFPNSCEGDWSKCGHITQILWGMTTDVGCGFAAGRYDALVCRYSPPGNTDGKYVLRLPYGWPCMPIYEPEPHGERGR